MIPGFFDDTSSSAARLHRGIRDKGSMAARQKEKEVKPIKTQLEQKKEILKLKKEIQEKKMIQSKLDEMVSRAMELEKQYKEQFGTNPPQLAKNSKGQDIKKEVSLRTPKQQSTHYRKRSIDVNPRSNSKEMGNVKEQNRVSSVNRHQDEKGQQKNSFSG